MPRRTSYRAGVPCWIDCLSCDPTATQDFYRALFGWTFDPGPNPAGPAGGYRLIRCRGEIIGGFGVLDAGRTGSWTTYLASKDLTATVAAVRMLGGRIVLPPTPVGRDGTLCLALDTTGTAVGFFCGAHADGVVLIDEPGAVVRHQLHTGCLTAAASSTAAWSTARSSPTATAPGSSSMAGRTPICCSWRRVGRRCRAGSRSSGSPT